MASITASATAVNDIDRCVRSHLHLKQPLYAIALEAKQRCAAIACKSDVKLINIRPSGLIDAGQVQFSTSGRDSVVLTDVAWSGINDQYIAASSTGGAISIFSVQGQTRRQVWSSTEGSRAVNRLSWHCNDGNMLSSAHQDGSVKIWDHREKQDGGLVKSLHPRFDAARNIQFDPFHDHIVAGSFENGHVVLWDLRATEQPFYKLVAHVSSVQALAWSRSTEWLLASGGRDTLIKIWDLSSALGSSGGTNTTEVEIHAQPTKPIYTMTTVAPVGQVAWRNIAFDPFQLASAATGDRSNVSVWKPGYNGISACELRGHGSDPCNGFAWLDTPSVYFQDSDASASPSPSSSSLSGTNQHIISVGKDGLVAVQDLRNGYFPRQHIARNVTAISSRGHVAFQRSNLHKHDLLDLIVRPSSLVTSNAEAEVQQEDSVSIGASAQVNMAPDSPPKNWFDDYPSRFGMPFSRTSAYNVVESQRTLSEPQSSFEDGGTVVVGMANIYDLTTALELSTGRAGGGAAEGGAFDPAVVKLLAMSYVLDHTAALPAGAEVGGTDSVPALDAEAAFLQNERVALNAGLVGHGAIMSSFASLVRLLAQPPSVTGRTAPGGDSVHAESSSPLDDDPFRALAQASIRDLLSELLDVGDCQHFVVCFEILRRCALLDGIADSGRARGAATTTSSEASQQSPTGTPPGPSSSQTSRISTAWTRPEDRKGFGLDPSPASQLLSDLRVREAYLSYIDILSRLGLFNATNDLIVASKDQYISDLSKKGVRLKVGCGNCGKEIAADQASVNTAGISVISALWCPRCLRCADSCAVCMQPVMGLYRWCPVCSHGGHVECIDDWFRRMSSSGISKATARRNASSINRRIRAKKGYLCGPLGLSEVNAHSFCPAGCGHKCLAMDEKL